MQEGKKYKATLLYCDRKYVQIIHSDLGALVVIKVKLHLKTTVWICS